MKQRALITGCTGQDALYLSELLSSKDYEVFGLVRGQNNPKLKRVKEIVPEVKILEGDLRDLSSLLAAMDASQPTEVYNLGAISFVGLSWKQPIMTSEITGLGVLNMLEAVRIYSCGDESKVRFLQASSSEMFGKVRETPQNEMTPFHPRSPYGTAKTFGHYATVNYRESYNMFACSAISFNHESSRRGLEFVTRKITNAAARIYKGLDDELHLGNLEAMRDWGFAGDFCRAFWLMLQQEEPKDYVIATGESHSVKELLGVAFGYLDLEWRKHVKLDSNFVRPAEVDTLIGDASKARTELNWKPEVSFSQMIRGMVDYDLELLEKES